MGNPILGAFNIRKNGEGIERRSTKDVDIIPKTDKPGIDIIVKPNSKPDGAFNIRKNGEGIERRSTKDVDIIPKTDKPGIDIIVKPNSKPEDVHIPVIVTQSGFSDKVYNDFIIGENAEVTIIAGCGIHNCGCDDSQHDGIHRFVLKKGAKLKYTEKHYGEGTEGGGKRILNPVTIVEMEEDSYCEMETVQIRGVDSTKRDLEATLGKNAKIVVLERLLTHDDQFAELKAEEKEY